MSYSIDQFSKITGISKLVLRTWENRYDYLKANRTKTNLRFYSDQLLIKALKTKHLINSGYKISFITKKNDTELDDLIGTLKNSADQKISSDYYINKMIESGLKYDAKLFNSTYKECLKEFDHIEFYKNIMLPTFSKIGLFWLTNRMNPAQEHFLSEMFKQKVYSEINKANKTNYKSKTWLLFLPPNEHHEIGLLFSRFLLIKNGFNVIYLGANVPLDSIKQVSKTKKIDNLLFFTISNFSKTHLDDTISYLDENLKKSNKYLVANSINQEKVLEKSKIKIINNLEDFLILITG
jgi:methanogenic corrinoid protein MtbC1